MEMSRAKLQLKRANNANPKIEENIFFAEGLLKFNIKYTPDKQIHFEENIVN